VAVSEASTGGGSAPIIALVSASIQSAAIARRRHLRGEWTGPGLASGDVSRRCEKAWLSGRRPVSKEPKRRLTMSDCTRAIACLPFDHLAFDCGHPLPRRREPAPERGIA
jgi:hypothetical protein